MKSMLMAATMSAAMWFGPPAWADPFFFQSGAPDGLLGALSQPADSGHHDTETADDFILGETTSIAQATVIGLIPAGASPADISNVEVEVYHIFPKDSVVPPSNRVPSRINSPGDVEIDSATRDGAVGTLVFSTRLVAENFSVANTVVDGINESPHNLTLGEGRASGQAVEITIDFTPPIVLPAEHYFLRPQVRVAGGEFLYLSAPKPIAPPGTPFVGDLQAWIRNADLQPDWLRIGADIIGGTRTFNMTFSLNGDTIPKAGLPGQANCHGKTISALAHQFGGVAGAASTLGFSSVQALQDTFEEFCAQ